ncbi:hypothetical protein NQ314_007023 [Rhamnusium bicolor]|uniref:Uncharacterized protein n=1 Tax=Rhamnusium bicolor TaxID=1586634 RepID=A0AAV8YVG6_9CUCU|nr:hypothetical protein NQ314_007023 [Rhamnusium bicolor]
MQRFVFVLFHVLLCQLRLLDPVVYCLFNYIFSYVIDAILSILISKIYSPDGHCSNISDQSKWPLQPGVLIQVNKLNNVSISQLSSKVSPFKSTSVSKTSTYFKYKRNKSKVYARLERLKDFLGITRSRHHVPIGIKESASGVVTFKRINPNVPAARPCVINSRKRKKPGYAPNPSSIEDKARLGAVPPVGGTVDPLSDPDKGFYENLPFHNMQNPPNKPISIIAPFNQGNNAHSFTSSTKSLLPSNQTSLSNPFGSLSIPTKTIKRHQSFHGFQNVQTPLTNLPPYFPIAGNVNDAYLNSYASQQFRNIPGFYTQNLSNQFIPSIFSQFPPHFRQTSGFNTISGISVKDNPNYIHKVQSTDNINRSVCHQTNLNAFITSHPYTAAPQTNRIIGRNESQFDVRRTASGINPPQISTVKEPQANKPSSRKSYSNKKLSTIVEKRFGSLEIKKHKCYSPTFYSMRCKKHAKKRPLVYALPKKCFSDIGDSNNKTSIINNESNDDFENLTDSIQIFEQHSENVNDGGDSTPVPAPRCRKHKKSEIVYANISPSLNNPEDSNTSTENDKNDKVETTVTEAQVHVSNDTNKKPDEEPTDVVDGFDEISKENFTENESNRLDIDETVNTKNVINRSDHSPKLVAVSPKQNPSKLLISPHALKNSPTLKVSPNFVKPKTESPKGALSLQIKAKIKPSPVQSPADNPDKTILTELKDEEKPNEQFPEIPQMPILNPQTKWSPNIANANNQNAFYTLTTPHFKQLNAVVPPQYSATIPHQKHAKLIPKALFQEQLSKSKSFSSKSKQKKHHFQIPLQKCHSFKFQTAESYFQPIKNIHEENLFRNGYATNYPESSHHGRHHKRDKPKQKTKGPLVLRRPIDYQENIHFQENMQNSVQLQYPQPMLGRNMQNASTNKPNGVVYADLDMPSANNKKSSFDSSTSKTKSQKSKPKTEYATLKFNEVGQEIDV